MPQHSTPPAFVSAQVYSSPAAIAVAGTFGAATRPEPARATGANAWATTVSGRKVKIVRLLARDRDADDRAVARSFSEAVVRHVEVPVGSHRHRAGHRQAGCDRRLVSVAVDGDDHARPVLGRPGEAVRKAAD